MSLAKRLVRLETGSTGGERTVFIMRSLLDGKLRVQGKSFSTEQEARASVDGRFMIVSTQVPEPHPLPEGFGK